MKIRSLFDIVQDSKDVTDFFEDVETVDQMISKLERLKKRPEAEDFLACVISLKISQDAVLDDMLEMSSNRVEDDEEEEFDEKDLADLGLDDDKPEEPGKPPEDAKDKT